MEFENRVYPNREQMKGFFEEDSDNQPIFMINLLSLKKKLNIKMEEKHHLVDEKLMHYMEKLSKSIS
tara:strand:- start:782 stop:982 length:201 start_codon:yes stop_codon:yes gene_type:complete